MVLLSTHNILQLKHSFEVKIRICQLENSDVHRGKAEVNITFAGWLILMLTEKECTNWFVVWYCLSFPSFIKSIFIFINLLKSDVPSALKTRLFQQLTSQISETLLRFAKELHFLNYCSHKMKTF